MFAATFNVNLLASKFFSNNSSFYKKAFFRKTLCDTVLSCSFKHRSNDFPALTVGAFCHRKRFIDMLSRNRVADSHQFVRTYELLCFDGTKCRVFFLCKSLRVKTIDFRCFLNTFKLLVQSLLLWNDNVRNDLNLKLRLALRFSCWKGPLILIFWKLTDL